MANMLDYIKWRGDLSFEVAPFNEVDNLILSELAYLNFSGIVQEEVRRGIRLEKAVAMYFNEERNQSKNTGDLIIEAFFEMIRLMAKSPRYQKLKLKMYVEALDLELEKQFGALTIDLGNRQLYIAYRGTDDTLVGWKEDFKMSVMKKVPSQEEALAYLEKVATRYRGYKFYLGGHSKGGNLAVFTAVNMAQCFKNRLIKVFNNDGPGFKENILGTVAYQSVADRIVTLVPQSSIIGMLLEHEENYVVVQSTQKGILQHDGFSWEVCGPHFVHLKSITPESQMIDRTLKRFLNNLTLVEREAFTNALFEILAANDKKTLTDVKEESWKTIMNMVKAYEGLEKESKKVLLDIIGRLLMEGIKSLLEN